MRTISPESCCSQANHGSPITSCSSAPADGIAAAIHLVGGSSHRRAAPCGARAGACARSPRRARVAADSGAGPAARRRRRGRRASSSRASTSSRSVVIWIDPSAARGHSSLRAIPVELEPVAVGIAQVERLADAVIGRAVERDARVDQAAQRVGERGAIGIADRGVVEPGRSRAAAARRRGSPRY